MITQHKSGSYFDTDDPGEPGYAGNVPRLSVTDEECELLTWFARGRFVLELGTGLGVSTRALYKQCEGLATIDPDPWVRKHVWPTLDGMLCVTSLRELVDADHYADLAFIDGNHKYDSVVADLRSVLPFLADGALIVLHDIKASSVREAVINTCRHFVAIETKHGLGLVWKRDVLP